MKYLSLILPALAAASPLLPRQEDGLGTIRTCGFKIALCPINQVCTPISADCTNLDICAGICLPKVLFPTGNLPTATLTTATGLPTAGLPTTNIFPRRAQETQLARRQLPEGDVGDLVPELSTASLDTTIEWPTFSLPTIPFPSTYTLIPVPTELPGTGRDWPEGREFQQCGGHVAEPEPCPKGYECIDDPWGPACGMACDAPGICVVPGPMCGGIAGLTCPGKEDVCIDVPHDGCDPENGGRDCAGMCI